MLISSAQPSIYLLTHQSLKACSQRSYRIVVQQFGRFRNRIDRYSLFPTTSLHFLSNIIRYN